MFYMNHIGLINTDFTYKVVLKIVKHIDVFSGASFLVHFYKIFHPRKFFLFFLFLIINMELAKLQKKLEIKAIIDDFRKFIEVCGSNY